MEYYSAILRGSICIEIMNNGIVRGFQWVL